MHVCMDVCCMYVRMYVDIIRYVPACTYIRTYIQHTCIHTSCTIIRSIICSIIFSGVPSFSIYNYDWAYARALMLDHRLDHLFLGPPPFPPPQCMHTRCTYMCLDVCVCAYICIYIYIRMMHIPTLFTGLLWLPESFILPDWRECLGRRARTANRRFHAWWQWQIAFFAVNSSGWVEIARVRAHTHMHAHTHLCKFKHTHTLSLSRSLASLVFPLSLSRTLSVSLSTFLLSFPPSLSHAHTYAHTYASFAHTHYTPHTAHATLQVDWAWICRRPIG